MKVRRAGATRPVAVSWTLGREYIDVSKPNGFSGRTWRGPWDAFLAQAAAYRERFERDGPALTYAEAVQACRLVAPLCDRDLDPDEAERAAAVRRFSYQSPDTGRICFNEENIGWMLTAFEAEHACGVKARAADSILADKWERYFALRFLRLLVSEDLVSALDSVIFGWMVRAVPILAREEPLRRPPGRYNRAINDGRDLCIRACIEALFGCGLPVTASGGDSLAGAVAAALRVPERTIRKVWERWALRDYTVNEAAPAELRLRALRRSREYFAVDVRCADCGETGKVPKFRSRKGFSRLCTDCKPPNN